MLQRILPALPVLPIVLLLALLTPTVALADLERIEFFGFVEGDVVRDQYMFRGLRIGPDSRGGPFWDDAELFDFLLDSPPGLLNFNPLTAGSGPGRVHASVGTYVFDMVDPTNPLVPSYTDHAEAYVVLIDSGQTVLTAYGAAGEVLGTDTLSLSSFSFNGFLLSVTAPGIQRFTLTTPLVSPTIGALVDTVSYDTPAVLPSRHVDIDIRPGTPRNLIRLGDVGFVTVAILSSPDFEPARIDPARVLFQYASPGRFQRVDRNHDRIPDLLLDFPIRSLQGLTTESTNAWLTAVDADGTSLKGSDSVMVQRGPTPGPTPGGAPTSGSGGSRLVQKSQ